jgi:NADPH:quinone reductase
MKALTVTRFGGAEVLEWREVSEPKPSDGEVLIEVAAVAVDWADIIKRESRYPGGPVPPFISGHNLVGTAIAVGPGATGLVGTRVFGAVPDRGVAAERVAVPAHLLYPAPDGLSDHQLAGFAGSYFTAQIAVGVYGQARPGDRVLVHAAAGAFGSAAVQIARARGAALVLGTAGGRAKVDRALEFGAHAVFDYTDEDFVQGVLDRTAGQGLDLVVESVGGDVLERSFDCLRPLGRLVSVGASSGRSTRRFRLHTLFETGVTVGGFSLGHLMGTRPDVVDEAARVVIADAEAGRLKPAVSHVFPAEQAADAHRHLESRQAVGRVVIAFRG